MQVEQQSRRSRRLPTRPYPRKGKRLAILPALAALAMLGGAAALAGTLRYHIARNPTDQAAAIAASLHRSDVGPGWRGGLMPAEDADLGEDPCPRDYPRYSDLDVTGAVLAQWVDGPSVAVSIVAVFK